MKHDDEMRLRRDARADEREVPERMMGRVRAQLELEGAPDVAQPPVSTRPFLVAAAILAVAGGIFWAVSTLVGRGRTSGEPGTTPDLAHTTHVSAPMRVEPFAFTLPAQSMSLATRAEAPLEREWEHVKSDSKALLRDFERQIPLIASRD